MNRNYKNINPRFHPYRDKYFTIKKNKVNPHRKFISTTGQLVLNMTDKELIFYTDIHNSKNAIYINKLPKDYMPKIRITIKETEKQLNPKRKLFTKKYLNKIYDKFDYEPNRKIEHTNTKKINTKKINTKKNKYKKNK
jgi:hypothetical protein